MGDLALAVNAALEARLRKKLASGFNLEVELEFAPGFHIIFGASGAGKTTLLDCIAGFLKPDEGSIVLGDRTLLDISKAIDVPTHLRGIGYVLQSQALFPHLTIRQNVAFGLREGEGTRVLSLAESLDIAEFLDRKPAQLSAGQRQRAALARTLVCDPAVLLMDEPLAALDVATKSGIVEFLRGWNAERQIPILYVTHDREEAYTLGERLIILEEGRVAAVGTPQQVLSAPARNTVAQLAGFENLLNCQVVSEHPEQGTMSCRIAATEVVLEAPLTKVDARQLVLGIRAGDILVASERPKGLSARNILLGTIESIEQRGVLVRLLINVSGAKFEAHVTPAAQLSLGLAGGRPAWLIIKTYSCHLLNP